MRPRIAIRALFASALAATCYLALPAAQPVAFIPYYQPTEYSIGTPYPVDVAVTFNGRRSAVRSAISTGTTSAAYSNGITIWDLSTATPPAGPLASFQATGEGTNLAIGGYQPSDRIELTNTRGIATGSGVTYSGQDTTYIDVFNAGLTPAMIISYVIAPSSSTAAPNEAAGHTNDVVITRDGAYAIVNSNNWIHIVDAQSPTAGNIIGFNIGAPTYGPGGLASLCTPNSAVDSIAVSNDRAVVTTARLETTGYVTWVYLIDLNTLTIVLEQRIAPPIGFSTEVNLAPHDVAITPDGQMAVVTMNRMIALFDLVGDTMLGSYYDAESSRVYQKQVDSVEVNNDRAVVTADRKSATTGIPVWQAEVWQINRVSIPYLSRVVRYNDPNYPDGPESRSHDLAIAPGDTQALVRTSFDNVFITSLATPPTQAALPVLPSPNGSNAYAYDGFGFAVGYTQFSSDAVTIAPLINTPTPYQLAVTIGGSINAQGVYQGQVDFIDLAAATPTVFQTAIVSSSTASGGCVPLDLALTRDCSEVVVRSADLFGDAPTASGVDVIFFSIPGYGATANFGGTGGVVGLDSLAVGLNGQNPPSSRKRATSISEDHANVLGRIHVVDN